MKTWVHRQEAAAGRASALLVAMALGAVGFASRAAAASVDFARDIRPIFEQRCHECHGAQKQKSGLRLDRKSSALKPGDSGQPAIVPGHSAGSLLLAKVTSSDPDERMPPKGERLTAEQVALLRAWIDQGATWPESAEPKHWAYVMPQRPPLPKVKNRKWPRNGIDYFVLERLEQEKLSPAPEADRATLIRRVSLDLTGLPPTVKEVDEFLADKSPEAYEKVVDRLLASPHYGERWARPWLDLARYADTQGYEKDNRRAMWPYRDWVIRALNRNLPFDQFTIEQLAGDLLPDATPEQRVATGFHRNTMTNTEGGTDNEEFRYEAVVDRVNTTFSVWLATTFACAQCHNHKYDPFTTVEYYRVLAFLNNTEDADYDDERPTMKVFGPGQRAKLESLRAAQKAAEQKLNEAAAQPEFTRALAAWEQRASAAAQVKWETLDPVEFKSAAGTPLTKAGDGALLSGGETPATDTFTVTTKTALRGVTAFRLEALPDNSLPGKGPGRSESGNIVLSEFKLSANGRPVALTSARADFAQDGFPVAAALDGKDETGWAWAPQSGKRHYAVFVAAPPVGDGAETTLTFRLEHQAAKIPKHVLGKFRLSATTATAVNEPEPPEEIRKILAAEPDKRDAKQRENLADHFKSLDPALKPLLDAVAAAKKAADDFEKTIPITSVMAELEKPRETRRHVRGAYLSTAEVVTPGTPETLPPFPPGVPTNRLGFARWLVSTNNPLTARVTVNRFWEEYFGTGIVETSQDFGTQGEPPSHPKLLDWLATEFLRLNWDMKAMHKTIVMAATYRQSSRVGPELLARDPFNRLLARGPRVRLEAEMVRDQALAVSGLLSPKLGGPSVMPPQPDGLWMVVYSGDKWETSQGDDKYRRGLYTFWRRSMPHPAMTTFDAPTREFCVIKRPRSNTPLQALVLLNDPAYLECAQALARRLMSEAKGGAAERVRHGFRLCLARAAKPAEAQRLVALYEQELARFKQDPQAAARLAACPAGNAPADCDVAELAAWTVVANVLLNLDEVVTKG
jgi:mono/diheme cytochrome c family protein